jgi:hypothetical protein
MFICTAIFGYLVIHTVHKSENLKERDHLGDLDVHEDGTVILK